MPTSRPALRGVTLGLVLSIGSLVAAAPGQAQPTDTVTLLGSSPSPSPLGETVTFTATVIPVPTGTTPTGTVDFFAAGTIELCNDVAVASGVATCATSTLAMGSHSIQAIYTSDAPDRFGSSTSALLIHTVVEALKCPSTFAFNFSGDQYADCFRALLRGEQIEAKLDVGGTNHDSLVFTGSAGVGGGTWLTVYDATPLTPEPGPTFGAQILCADVLVHRFNNVKGAGVVALLTEGPDEQGLALVISDAGNTDMLRLSAVDGDPAKKGKLATLKSVSLKGGIALNTWYRLVMTVDPAPAAGRPTVTGQVFKHIEPTNPNSDLGEQVGSTLEYHEALPQGVRSLGQSGILAQAVSAKVDLSVTNFSNDPALCLPPPVACDASTLPGCELSDGEAVTSLAGAAGSQKHFFIDIPAGLPSLSVQTSGGTGDVDLYVKFGSAPTLPSFDCRPFRTGNVETCTIFNPQAGRWHVMLYGFASYNGVTLVAND